MASKPDPTALIRAAIQRAPAEQRPAPINGGGEAWSGSFATGADGAGVGLQ